MKGVDVDSSSELRSATLMNRSTQALQLATKRTELGLYNPLDSTANTANWKINGYRATILVWTTEEWERLPEQPTDAQYFPCGIWCALRME